MELVKSREEYQKRIKRILITEDQISKAISEAGRKIEEIYDGSPILFLCLLKGSFVFAADLCRAVNVPCKMSFISAKSYYNGTVSTGKVNVSMDIEDLSGYHVVVVEDIIDTGRTLSEVVRLLKEKSPLSLRVITLLDKPDRRVVDFKADISLFTIPDHFVIGYGLDCGEYYRNLPYVAEYDSDVV